MFFEEGEDDEEEPQILVEVTPIKGVSTGQALELKSLLQELVNRF